MSTSELILEREGTSAAPGPGRTSLRLLRSELGLVFRRRRNLAMLAVLAAAPLLLGVILRVTSTPSPGDGPPLLSQVTQSGLFLGLASMVMASPLFLPMIIGVVSGDTVAGEAQSGTLRNLLVVPAGRTRLLLVKYASVIAYALAAVLTVVAVGIVTGLVLFPAGEVVLLSGSAVPLSEALVRAAAIVLYMAFMIASLGAVGLFFSTLTEVPVGAMAATVTVGILSQILDAIPQLSAIHELLPTHWWLSFIDLLREPVAFGNMASGLLVAGAYIALFGSLAWARFTTRDITA